MTPAHALVLSLAKRRLSDVPPPAIKQELAADFSIAEHHEGAVLDDGFVQQTSDRDQDPSLLIVGLEFDRRTRAQHRHLTRLDGDGDVVPCEAICR